MIQSLSIWQGVLASAVAASIVFAYLMGKVVGADEERKRIVRSKANTDKTRRAS